MSLPLSTIPVGRYIVAVSGGVDSMVLLHALHKQQPELELVVAHFDHGIREDSARDAAFVGNAAISMGLEYVIERAELGQGVSEATARKARYDFLQRVKAQYDAQAIITAHHVNDILETTIINMARGTGWRGLASLRSTGSIIRPLLSVSKPDIISYAKQHALTWHEDTTNSDTRYLRNRIRLEVLPRIAARDSSAASQLIKLSKDQQQLRVEFDEQLRLLLQILARKEQNQLYLRRVDVVRLPLAVCLEVLRAAAVQVSGNALERQTLRRMRIFACSARPGKRMEITKNLTMRVLGDSVIVYNR